MQEVWNRLVERFGPEAIAEWLATVLPTLLSAVLVFLVFYLLWRILAAGFHVARDRVDVDATLASFIESSLKYVVLTLGVISALTEIGINTTSVLTSLGVVGLTLGFAARDTLSNLISGIFIFWDRPFVLDDLIEIEGRYGRVDSITLRSTRVVTVDGKMIAIPNSTIVNSMVTSYTNFPNLRIGVDVTISVEESIQRVRETWYEMLTGDERFLDDPPPQLVVIALNDYNVALQCRAWLRNEKRHIAVSFELREELFERLREAGVDMPFETFALAEPIAIEARVRDRGSESDGEGGA